MNTHDHQDAPREGGAPPFDTSACAVEAYGVARVAVGDLAALRRAPGPPLARKIAPSLLKHADPQTLLGLAAVLDAIQRAGWGERSFDEWGVVAAPRFLGRFLIATALERFQQQGPAGVSPLLAATLSLHAVAGSLSLALKAHGLHYGVGGGPGHLAEGVMAGMAARHESGLPGVWVVATGFDPEPVPDTAGQSTTEATGYAVALALNPHAAPAQARFHLRLVASAPADAAAYDGPILDRHGCPRIGDLVALADFLDPRSSGASRPSRWYLPLVGGGAIEFDDDAARGADTGRVARAG